MNDRCKNVDDIFKNRVKFILESTDSCCSGDRTGTGTIKTPILPEMVFDLTKGFPLLSIKKTSIKNIFHELNWFLRGDTNIKYLLDNKCNIWTDNAYDYYKKIVLGNKGGLYNNILLSERDVFIDSVKSGLATFYTHPDGAKYFYGDLGNVYGKQWRKWAKYEPHTKNLDTSYEVVNIDQIQNAINTIKHNPTSRRIIVSAWNPSELCTMALPPCHMMFQFIVHGHNNNLLSMNLNVRSNDFLLGSPYNIASYALLLEFFAAVTGKTAKFLKYNVGDAHIYDDHIDSCSMLLERVSREMPKFNWKLPQDELLGLNPWDINFDMFSIDGYDPHPIIKLKMAV